ncbi:MAG: DegT/DnrJ/EryC1/StrS family aminotransferase [Dissulfuribacterales bacterium]
MRRRWIGTGPKVREFEEDFAAFKGFRHAIVLNSYTVQD